MGPTIIDPGIFKAYDIRALVGKEINGEVAYKIGRALVSHTGAKKIAVGYDMRPSSLEIEKGLIDGITDQGADVIRVGMIGTPMIYYASWNLPVDAAVIVTASHNPAEWNGMKFCYKDAVPIGEGSGMEEIRDLAIQSQFSDPEQKGKVEENIELKEKYFNYITSFFKKGLSRKKVVIDFANGMGILEKPIFERISEDVTAEYMHDELDGNFPNHEANPLKTETLADLQKAVVEKGADLGIAYDGDADRVGFVDEKGQIVPMDFPIALLGKEILKKQPGALTLIDLRSSNAIGEALEKAGGRVGRCRVGHSLIKKQMREEGATFAGELSGHYFFEENSKAEMTTLAIMMILNLMNETGRKMSELADELRVYFQSGEINSVVEDKNVVMGELKRVYAEGELSELDGIRIDFADWWFNVRPSNTEPVLRLNLEAKTKEMMEQKRDEVLAIIRKS
ncbi:MAG TPA: phosphomannomutase/phosphoglucomutase [Candidatus Moranbacteria bacterium]|nr:phosphomannomutase/phosphoglucomutase [Candidatus Moranbacteria bacterium]